jgi:antitoxin component of MazEF toxin-antitoxin module
VLELSVENNVITLSPQEYSLNDMLSLVSDENKHQEMWDEDDIEGRENW